MKQFKLVTFVIPLLLSNAKAISVPKVSTSELTYVYITPLILNNTSRFLVAGSGTRKDPLLVTIKIYNDIYPEGTIIASVKGVSNFERVIEYDNKLTRSTNTIEVIYENTKGTAKSNKKTINRISGKTAKFGENSSVIGDSKSYVFSPSIGWKEMTSEYRFANFDDLYIPSFYHKLDLSDFMISMSEANLKIFNCKASLLIENYVATNYQSDDPYLTIPLTFESVRNTYLYLKPAIDLFVDKETLEMSLESHQNYVKTRHFYLPRNGFKNQEDYTFTILFQDFGNDHLKVYHTFKMRALSNTIGDCVSSEYCIIKS